MFVIRLKFGDLRCSNNSFEFFRIRTWLILLLEQAVLQYFGRPCLYVYEILWVEWVKRWSITSIDPQWICFVWIFVHLRNSINVRRIEILIICLFAEGSEDRFVIVQHFWCRTICLIACRVHKKWMESKFLDQDFDVVFLVNKRILIGGFVGRDYEKVYSS